MTAANAHGITIEYETFGDPGTPPVLLIMGLGGQLTAWDPDFCRQLAGRGFFVVRYDNRDVGLSTWFDDAGEANIGGLLDGTYTAPYAVTDMAADAARLLDALGIATAHIVGVSMGGMIAQTFALDYPERTRTLVSIMSTTGDTAVGQPHPEALATLMVVPATTREEAIEQGVKGWRVIGSPGFPFDEDRIRRAAAEAYDRGFHPAGTARQLAAVITQPDRTAALGRLDVPTLVIHGEADVLVDPSGGRSTAAAIPGATLTLVPGMGHDLPPQRDRALIDELTAHFARG